MKLILFIVFLSLLTACSSKPYMVKHVEVPALAEHEKVYEVYVVNHGWHTGFVVPAEKIQKQLPELRKRFGDTPYIEFGWGDNDFYQAQETTLGLTLNAILWPTKSVIHAVAVPVQADKYFAYSKAEMICLSNKDYSSLIRFISDSFYKDEHGNILALQGGIYGNSQFYKAEGDFYFMNTCNIWTAKGLKSAGMDISPAFKFSAGSIMDYLKEQKQALQVDSTGQLNTTNQCRQLIDQHR